MRTVFGILTFMSVWFFLGEFIKYVDKKPLLEQIRAKGSDVSRFNRSFSGRMLHFAGELGKVLSGCQLLLELPDLIPLTKCWVSS